MFKGILMALSAMTTMASPCFGEMSVKFSALGRVGYFLPMGQWMSHRYASGIDQFQGGYAVSPELEIKFDDIAIGILYSYANMSTAQWEDFVNSHGEGLAATGSLSQIGGVLRYYVVDTARHSIHIEGGLSYLALGGNEQYRGYNYEYDFLQSGAAFLAGAGYEYSFNRRLSMTLPGRFLWKPNGIKYPEGRTYDVFGVFFLPGLRLKF